MTIRRLLLHFGAVVLLATGVVLRVAFDDAFWAVVVGHVCTVLAVGWFMTPLAARIGRFRSRGAETRSRLNA